MSFTKIYVGGKRKATIYDMAHDVIVMSLQVVLYTQLPEGNSEGHQVTKLVRSM